MTALWTAAEIAAAIGSGATSDFAANGVSIDSRTTRPGDLFIALRGPNFDAHDFVADALAKGATAALVERVADRYANDVPLLVVADTLAALTALGRAGRDRSDAKILAVTGSVGKTGTKEALRHALGGQGPTHVSAASLNNQWGLPLSLARMPRETRFGVFEIGMNHAGEIAELSRIARPHIAVITTVEAAHLGYFTSVEAIADAKAEIFEGLAAGGTAILNRDNPHYARLADAARVHGINHIVAFGEHHEATVRLLSYRLGETESTVVASVFGETIRYHVALPGRHWVMNSLAVLASVRAAGADVAVAARALGALPGLPGRGRRISLPIAGGTVELIDESYNANPASVRAALAVLGAAQPGPGGRRIFVFGTMRELGAEASRLHAEMAEPIAAAAVDLVLTTGTDMEALRAALPERLRGPHAAASKELAPHVLAALRPGDVVSVKGSLGSRMAEIVKPLLALADAPGPVPGIVPSEAAE